MDTQPDSDRAYAPDTFSSSSTTNVGARYRPHPPRSTAQHRQHPYIQIPGRKPSTQKLRRVRENSSLGMGTAAGPLAAHQRRSTGIIELSLPTTPNVTPSIQPITKILIPDLTKLITRCSTDPITGGTYGNIYKCIYRGTEGDVLVAVKAIRPQYFSAEAFRRELGIWKRLRHSNILKFLGTTSDFGDPVALVAPWMTNGTLTSFLDQNNETLRLHDRLLLLRDIAAGLNYLHMFNLTQDGHADLNPIVHGDLTGTNVLIDGDRKAYLADFGLSGTFKKLIGMTYLAKLTCHPGAVRWAAPELLSGEGPDPVATTQSDMYSFGSIMLQALTGNVPWCHLTRDYQIILQVIGGKTHPRPNDDYVSDQHWNFMTRCWSMTYTDRPSAKEAGQFVGSALHLSTGPKSPTSSISSDERHLGIARNDYPRVLSVIQHHRLGWGESTNPGLTVTQTSQPQFASLDEAFSQNQYDNAATPSASTNVSTQLWRQLQGANYPYAPPHHVSHAAASHAHHAPAPLVGPSTYWAPASDTSPQYCQPPLPAPHSQPHAYPYNSSSAAPYHGQQNQPVPTDYVGFGLTTRDLSLHDYWTAFMRDNHCVEP